MSTNVTVRPKQLTQLLSACLTAGENVLITGAPGVGKTAITAAACTKVGAEMLTIYVSVSDPTDLHGIPFVVEGRGEHLPFGALRRIAEASAEKKRVVVFLDDFGQGTPATQAAAMQLLDRYRDDPNVSFVIATNRRADRAGVSGVLEPVKSRFATIVELQPVLDDYIEWALANNVVPEQIAFLRFRPELLHKFEPTADITNSPCPRTWAAASRLLRLGLPPELEYPALSGAVGAGAAGEFVAFLRTFRALPDVDSLLADPESAPVPTDPSALYAVSAAVACRTDAKNAEMAFRYAERLAEAGYGEFGVLLVRDAARRDKKLQEVFVTKFGLGKIAQLIRGD